MTRRHVRVIMTKMTTEKGGWRGQRRRRGGEDGRCKGMRNGLQDIRLRLGSLSCRIVGKSHYTNDDIIAMVVNKKLSTIVIHIIKTV